MDTPSFLKTEAIESSLETNFTGIYVNFLLHLPLLLPLLHVLVSMRLVTVERDDEQEIQYGIRSE